jgi:protein O-mannosyl-transferase
LLIFLLFGAACATKEHAVALLPALLLTDYFWGPESSLLGIVRRNWKLYALICASAVVAGAGVWIILAHSPSAGFNLPDVTWYQYFFTQCRMLFFYVWLFLLPVSQSVDHAVSISRTIISHGTILWLLAIVAVVVLAFHWRRKYRLACFGALLFLILLAPTSSFVPIRDPIAEHRMYLPALALTLVLLEVLIRLRISSRQLAVASMVVLGICAILTYNRNLLWGDPALLWQDAIAKAPNKARGYNGLATAYLSHGRCAEAAKLLEEASKRMQLVPFDIANWGEAEACLGKFDQAEKLIGKAAELTQDAHLYVRLGAVRASQGKVQESFDAFTQAVKLAPDSDEGYLYRAHWYEAMDKFPLAARDYRHALAINPKNTSVQALLENVQHR